MRYFEDAQTGQVFAYDDSDPSQLPYMEKAIADGCVEVTGSYPTDTMKKDDCAMQAEFLLQKTDWSVLPDVTIGTPKLTNQSEFISYRSQIRALVINPVVDPVWPTEPTPVWS